MNLLTAPGAESAWYDEEVLARNPALFWADMGGALAYDLSGNGRHGYFVSNPAKLAGSTADGSYAVDLDGVADYVGSVYAPFVAGSQLTLMGFARRDTNSSADELVATSSGGNPTELQLRSGTDLIDFKANGVTVATWTFGSTGVIRHWAIAIDETANTAKLWINGVSLGTQTTAFTYHASTGTFQVGAFGVSNNPADVAVEKIAVFESLLSDADVLAIYNARNVKGPRPFADRVKETFDGASLANYITSGGTWTESGGAVTSPATGVARHTARSYGDVDTWVEAVPATAGLYGFYLRYIDANNHIHVWQVPFNNTLRIYERRGGVDTQLVALAGGVAQGTNAGFLRVAIAGNEVVAEYWATEPSPGGQPVHAVSATLTGAAAAALGAGVVGTVAIWTSSQVTAFRTHVIRPLARPTVRRSNTWAESGTYSVRQTATQGAGGPPAGLLVGLESERVTVAAADGVDASAAIEPTDGYTAGEQVGIAFYDSSGRFIDLETTLPTVSPAGTAKAAVVVGGELGSGETITVYADDLVLDSEPQTTITDGPDDPTEEIAATFTFEASESATFEARLDGGSWATVTSPHTVEGLGLGEHTWEVRATDVEANVDPTPAEWAWEVIDITAPTVSITDGPDDPAESGWATFTFSTGGEPVAVEGRLDGGDWVPVESPLVLPGISEGAHIWELRATDASDNAATVSWSWARVGLGAELLAEALAPYNVSA